MKISLLHLPVLPENVEEVVTCYQGQDILDVSGCSAAWLSYDEASQVVVVTALWVDDAAYERWLEDPRRTSSGAGMLQWISDIREVRSSSGEVLLAAGTLRL